VNLIRQNLDDIEKATKNLQLIYRTVNDSSQPSESIFDTNVRGASLFLSVTNMLSVLRAQAEDAVQTARFLAMKTKTQIAGTSKFKLLFIFYIFE
jgi:hypothetical protein